MEWLETFIDLFVHLDRHLENITARYGLWTYAILFTIIFLETGVVFTPFLPGDSLLFAAGAISALGSLDPWALFWLLSAAAILGDTANYWIGKHFGQFLLRRHSRLFKPQHLERTHAFFEKYGGKTIIIARFVPIVRTFAPFVAGMGAMTYSKFLIYNMVGGIAWVAICVGAGRAFGQQPFVKKHFELVILAIIFLSILPMLVEFVRYRWRRPATVSPAAAPPEEA